MPAESQTNDATQEDGNVPVLPQPAEVAMILGLEPRVVPNPLAPFFMYERLIIARLLTGKTYVYHRVPSDGKK